MDIRLGAARKKRGEGKGKREEKENAADRDFAIEALFKKKYRLPSG